MKSTQCTSLWAFNDTKGTTRCTMVCGSQWDKQNKQTSLVDRHVPYIILAVQIMYSYKSLLMSKWKATKNCSQVSKSMLSCKLMKFTFMPAMLFVGNQSPRLSRIKYQIGRYFECNSQIWGLILYHHM